MIITYNTCDLGIRYFVNEGLRLLSLQHLLNRKNVNTRSTFLFPTGSICSSDERTHSQCRHKFATSFSFGFFFFFFFFSFFFCSPSPSHVMSEHFISSASSSSSTASSAVSAFTVSTASSPDSSLSRSPAITQLLSLFNDPNGAAPVEPTGRLQPAFTSVQKQQQHQTDYTYTETLTSTSASNSTSTTSIPDHSNQNLKRKSTRNLRKETKRPFKSNTISHGSSLDLLNNEELTTFPQVYNRITSTFKTNNTGSAHSATSSNDIVFIEDYFESCTDLPKLASSQESMHSLSPFSTMKRKSCASPVKFCLHCKKPLQEFANTDFTEFVCKNCAKVQQQNPYNYSTSTLPILKSQRGDLSGLGRANSNRSVLTVNRPDDDTWYHTVRKRLRWRWRIKGLLPSQ